MGDFYNINLVAYYFNLLLTWISSYVKLIYDRFMDFPWVVKVAAISLTFSFLLILATVIRMLVKSWKRRRWEKIYNKLDKQYGEGLRYLMLPETNPNLSRDEIIKVLGLDDPNIDRHNLLKNFREKLSFARLLYRARISREADVAKRNNVQVIIDLFGTKTFLEEVVNKGAMNYKAEALHMLRAFKVNVNPWVANQLRNSKRYRVRRLANYASIMSSSNNDMEYFESKFFDDNCCIYDEIQLGYVLQRRLAMHRTIPNLAHLAIVQNNPSTQAVFVRLMHQFNQREYCHELEELFNHNTDKELMQEICRTWGYLNYTDGEESLQNVIVTQPDENKVSIMHALVRLGTGKSVDVFVDNYRNSGSQFVKYEALRCLFNYGALGMAKFRELEATAKNEEKKLFEFFKNPITLTEIGLNKSDRYSQRRENIYSVG